MSFFDSFKPDPTNTYQGYTPMPIGVYKLRIQKADKVMEAEAELLKLVYEVIEPTQYAGRTMKETLYLSGKNEKRANIGVKKAHSLYYLAKPTKAIPGGFVGCTFSAQVRQKEVPPLGDKAAYTANEVDLSVQTPPNPNPGSGTTGKLFG